MLAPVSIKPVNPVRIHPPENPRVFLELSSGGRFLGRIVFELFANKLPKTCENFRCLCTGEKGPGLHYQRSKIHRISPGLFIQGGDTTSGTGRGGKSIYGPIFGDEGFIFPHERFSLSMANQGPNTNQSQFFISLSTLPHLNQQNVVFGRVVEGQDVVEALERTPIHLSQRPVTEVIVTGCGQL